MRLVARRRPTRHAAVVSPAPSGSKAARHRRNGCIYLILSRLVVGGGGESDTPVRRCLDSMFAVSEGERAPSPTAAWGACGPHARTRRIASI